MRSIGRPIVQIRGRPRDPGRRHDLGRNSRRFSWTETIEWRRPNSRRFETPALFAALVQRRRRFVVGPTAAILIPCYAVILVAAFAPDWLAGRFPGCEAVSIGWPVGVGPIIGTGLSTGLSVRRANAGDDLVGRQPNPVDE
ncbi:DUF485 domain-containing protein [Paraburkholderia sp. B3]|uniref:DUF485 domain-containing protein n=1 Tax=Paraburkholderia sp. B3 TaxID=3134791 RepID=UPI003982BD7D